MVQGLCEAATRQMEANPVTLSIRWASPYEKDWHRQATTKRQHFVCVLDRHVFDHTQSVVFVAGLAEDTCLLKLCCPLTSREYDRIARSQYLPLLRSKVCLSVGFGEMGGIPYAYVAVKMSPTSSVIEMFEAMERMGRELERYVTASWKGD